MSDHDIECDCADCLPLREAENDARKQAELNRPTDTHLREILGQCWNYLWGPDLEALAADYDWFRAELSTLRTLTETQARELAAAEAEIQKLRGLCHSTLIATPEYCETCEMAYQSPESAMPRCPYCELATLAVEKNT